MIGDALGNPLTFTLRGAEQADVAHPPSLLDRVPGAKAVVADKGYDADALVQSIEHAGAEAVIPPRSNRRCPRAFDTRRYLARHLIENLFARLKQCRRLATRYDKLAAHFAAFVTLASICVWLA